jgi:catechol 2,3-dioxygenase-like lactoylglutathione lyase family enzyme
MATQHAKEITSPDAHEEYPGQTLVTRNHDVIRRWAEERGATPATVPGSEHEGHPGVLRFDFPGYGGEGLQPISWEDWFRAFDERGLRFLFQEHKKDGAQSNFFQLENPEREDG